MERYQTHKKHNLSNNKNFKSKCDLHCLHTSSQ